ncbi:exodeoxyribonuclease VII small subunit [bacterium]|nr:exodeoxyribonuclease VII small subunit [bacterium]
MERLEKIVERLEGDDVGLEEALAAFEEGVKLSRALSESLSGAEKKIEILLRQPDGTVAIEPFDPGLDDADLHEGHETDDDDT